LLVTRPFLEYLPDPGRIFTLKIILIKNSPSFIALYCQRKKVGKEFGETGYNIDGPSQILDEKDDECLVGEHIKATYPRPKIFTENKEIKSIHRKIN
jgi:hypothetical protein